MNHPRFLPHMQDQLMMLTSTRDQLTGSGSTFLLEQKLKAHYGKEHCIVTSNATTALLATCLASDLRGKEIVTSPLNWGGSIAPFSLMGNTVSLGLVERDSLNLDWRSIRLARSKDTAAVLVNDQFGTAHQQFEIRRECDRYGLLYISDSACSLGAFGGGVDRPAGALADVVITSFVSGKGIYAGEGGALLCDNSDLYEKLLTICMHPDRQQKELGWHSAFAPLNARMHPLAAQLLVDTWDTQMARLHDRQRLSHATITRFQERLSNAPFTSPQASTYFAPLMHLRDTSMPEENTRKLSFLHEQQQVRGLEVSFRIDPRIVRGIEDLRQGSYVALKDLMEQPWPSY